MRTLCGLVLALALLAAACDEGINDGLTYGSGEDQTSDEDLSTGTEIGADVGDTECEGVDVAGEGSVVAIYAVADGSIGALCVGSENAMLRETWDKLAEVSPPSELAAITALAGFESEESDTAAFTSPLFDDNESFVVAVNLTIAGDDADESQLTMVHELTHVFSLEQDQIDFQADPDECETFYNGSGCFLEDSYVVAWIEQFWSEDQIAGLPADGSVDEEAGEDRCTIDPSFLGGYAASHPEEDMAESFSAYVYAIDVDTGVDAKMAFFDQYPELAEFRSLAASIGETGFANNFGQCG